MKKEFILLAIIIVIFTALLVRASKVDSLILDESWNAQNVMAQEQ